jgi:hypothetical protein
MLDGRGSSAILDLCQYKSSVKRTTFNITFISSSSKLLEAVGGRFQRLVLFAEAEAHLSRA